MSLIDDDEIDGSGRDVPAVGDRAFGLVGPALEAAALVLGLVEGLAAKHGIGHHAGRGLAGAALEVLDGAFL